ncbi:MAG: serine--tRNA ligase [Mycoplasmataceae bacterium]|nr:serine--tRNA ligase [Mycoplasmataceae bacterium]
MINLKELKKNKEFYIKSFQNKGMDLTKEINDVIEIHSILIKELNKEQEIREELNNISSKFKTNPNDDFKIKAKKLSTLAKKSKIIIFDLKNEIESKASYFPNPPSNDVPIGKDENENILISSHLDNKKNNIFSKPHWEIIENNKMVLSEESTYISGSRHVIYNGNTALVVKALEKFMLKNAQYSNHVIIEPPVIVNKKTLYNTGQLPKFEEDLFKVTENQYLIPTAEVPLTNLVANKLLQEQQLPIKYVAGTNCFRKEAGSAGKDTRGLIRLHQFRKVELVTIGKPEDEKNDLNNILNTATRVLEKLELPYRLIQLCTGDSSFSSRKTIDIEVWMPGVKEYREISSVSSMGDFQSRRMKSRYKNFEGEKKFVFTYNGSGLAIGRTLAAIIENNIQENGMVRVPSVLKEFLSFDEF